VDEDGGQLPVEADAADGVPCATPPHAAPANSAPAASAPSLTDVGLDSPAAPPEPPSSPWAVGSPEDTTGEETGPDRTAELTPNERRARRSRRWLALVAVSALLLSMAAVAVIGLGIYRYRSVLNQTTEQNEEDDESSTKRAGLSTVDDEEEHEDEAPLDLDGVVKDTRTVMRGTIEVVDVGVSSASLPEVLLAQRIVADTKQQTLLLMITGRRCRPCDGVDASLDHPLMQEALQGVRLVRVDLEVFKDELKRMHMPTSLYPAFFLLSDDLRPYDAVHGGEWDEDVAKNIAPVLGSFIRGELRRRRHPEWAPTTSSIPI
jgi:hypothetical protein